MTSTKVATGRPENVIKNIWEIPQVLKEEGVKQPIIYLTKTIRGEERNVVVLGETHIATKKEERAADRIIPYFKHIGCEGLDIEGFIEGKFFFFIMHYIIYPFISIVFFLGMRSQKNISFIQKAYEYCEEVLSLEKGWKPSIRTRICFFVFPILFIWEIYSFATGSINIANEHGNEQALVHIITIIFLAVLLVKMPILKNIADFIFDFILGYIFDLGPSRERNMTKNLVTELNDNIKIGEIMILTGSAHTKPIAKILKKKYGFVEKKFQEP